MPVSGLFAAVDEIALLRNQDSKLGSLTYQLVCAVGMAWFMVCLDEVNYYENKTVQIWTEYKDLNPRPSQLKLVVSSSIYVAW